MVSEGMDLDYSFQPYLLAGYKSGMSPACYHGQSGNHFVAKERNTLNFALSSGMVQDIMRREELERPLCIY